MNMQRANIRSTITRLLASLCGFAVIGFSWTADAVPPPPPAPPPVPLGAAPPPPPPPQIVIPTSAPPPAAASPSAPPSAPLAPPPPPPVPERPMPSPVNAPQPNPNNGAWGNSAAPQFSWRPSESAIPPMWPTRIDYEDGDVVLPGYDIKTRAQKGLLVGGLTTFLVPYTISFLAGGFAVLDGGNRAQEEYGPLLIPVFGPFVTIAKWDTNEEDGVFLMLANGFAQTAGAAMIVSSILMPDKYLERMATLPGKPEVFVGAGSTTVRLHF